MGCTDAYREAMTRNLSFTAPLPPAPSEPPAAETDRESDTATSGRQIAGGTAAVLSSGAQRA
jgi:hypothetical protein